MTTTPEQAVIQAALLPCPFCGGVARVGEPDDAPNDKYPWAIVSFHAQGCFLMHSNINRHRFYATEAEAIAAWNTRLAHSKPASEGLRERVAEIMRQTGNPRWTTMKIGASEPDTHGRYCWDGLRFSADELLHIVAALQPLTEPQRLGQDGEARETLFPPIDFSGPSSLPERLADTPVSTPAQAEPVADLWPVGTLVRKRSGGQWHGRICGYYTTDLTAEGYAVESLREPGSVQIYPRKALELWEDAALPLLGAEERGLPQDVRSLVIEGRKLIYENDPTEIGLYRDFETALEAFAGRVRWDDEDEEREQS